MREMSVDEPESALHLPSGGDHAAGVARFRRLVWWSLVALAYVVGAFVAVAIVVSEPWGPLTSLGAGGAAASAWASARLLDRRLGVFPALDPGPSFDAPVGLVAIASVGALASVVTAASGPGLPTWGVIPGLAAGAVAVWVPRRRRLWTVAAAAALATAVAVSVHFASTGEMEGPQQVTNTVLMGLIALAFISTMWSWDVVVRLDRTRLLEAELAVADERLRFAADLHDVQGHHLHVIALESELATRLAGSDPEGARAHMEEGGPRARSDGSGGDPGTAPGISSHLARSGAGQRHPCPLRRRDRRASRLRNGDGPPIWSPRAVAICWDSWSEKLLPTFSATAPPPLPTWNWT